MGRILSTEELFGTKDNIISTEELFAPEPLKQPVSISRGAGVADDLPKFEPMDSHTRMQVTIQKLSPTFYKREQRREQVIRERLSKLTFKTIQPSIEPIELAFEATSYGKIKNRIRDTLIMKEEKPSEIGKSKSLYIDTSGKIHIGRGINLSQEGNYEMFRANVPKEKADRIINKVNEIEKKYPLEKDLEKKKAEVKKLVGNADFMISEDENEGFYYDYDEASEEKIKTKVGGIRFTQLPEKALTSFFSMSYQMRDFPNNFPNLSKNTRQAVEEMKKGNWEKAKIYWNKAADEVLFKDATKKESSKYFKDNPNRAKEDADRFRSITKEDMESGIARGIAPIQEAPFSMFKEIIKELRKAYPTIQESAGRLMRGEEKPFGDMPEALFGSVAYEVSGIVKGLTLGYVKPEKILEKFEYFREMPELKKKIAGVGGQIVGALAPISVISKGVGGGLKLFNIAKYSRPFISTLAQVGITGGVYGVVRSKEEHESRLENARDDAGMFVLFTAGMFGIDKVIKNIRFGKTKLYNSLRQDIINKFKGVGKSEAEATAVTDAMLRQAVMKKGGWDKVTRQTLRESKKFIKTLKTVEPTMRPAEPTPTMKLPLTKPIIPKAPIKPIATPTEAVKPVKAPAEVVEPQIIKQAQPKIKSISISETSKQIGIDNKLNQQADDEIVKMYSGIPFTDKEIDWSKAKGLGLKIAKTVSVEYPFRQIGAKETGLAIKTYASKAESGQELSKDIIIKLGDKYKLNKSDWNELPFARELPEQFKKLPTEQQAKLKPALKEIDKIFTKYRKEGTERKYWDTGFPESRIRSLEDESKSLVFKARKTKNPIEKTRIANQIAENYEAIDFLKHSGLKYVHLPVKLWISKLADTNPQLYTKLFSTKPKALYGRKTLKIQDLIDSKLIKKEDVDMRDILSNYIEYMERVKASDDIVRSAVKEGLAVFGEKEGYRTFPAYMFPEFSKYSFHPVFAEWLESTYTPFKKPSDINKIMAYAKLFTFTNPAFMGLTNAHQGIVAVGLKAIYPKTIKNAFKILKNKPDEYWEAQKEGISSKPFRSPYEDFRKDIEYIKKKQDSTLPKIVFSAIQLLGKFTKNPIMTAYQTQWNLTWQYFDRIPRFITYSALRNEGWSIRDSAQLAAQYHGDYAGVPIKTRQFLNKILYTPTYRIAMTKLQTELVASIFKNTRPEMINIGKGGTFRRKALSSLAILVGTLMGIDYSFRKQGWKREQFARRYYREIDTPEGKKEVVATLALPQNVMLRTMFRAGNISGVNPLLSSIRGFKWDLHPLWRVVALDIIATNRGSDNEPIYDPNALKNPNKAPEELIKIGWYATKEIVRMIGVFDQSAESAKRKKEAYSYARRDLNKLFYYILRPNMFAYLRRTEKQRKGMEAYILKKETIAKMRRLTDDEEVNEWASNLKEQIKKILE